MNDCNHNFTESGHTSMEVLDGKGDMLKVSGIPGIKCKRCGTYKITPKNAYYSEQKTLSKNMKIKPNEMSYLLMLNSMQGTTIKSSFKFHKTLFLNWKETKLMDFFEVETDFRPAREGPVARKMKPTTDKLERMGLVSISGDENNGYAFTITPDGQKLAKYILDTLPDKVGREFERTKEKYLFTSRKELGNYVHDKYPEYWEPGDTCGMF